MKADHVLINRHFRTSFIAGSMELKITGEATYEDLEDCEKVLEIAIGQIKRLREESGKQASNEG